MVEPYPCIVQTKTGSVRDLALIDEKGYSKSLESGILWTVHRETRRLLPYGGSTEIVRLERNEGWFLAVVELSGSGDGAEAGSAAVPEDASTEAPGQGESPDAGPASPDPGILLRLARLIGERKRELPEGSYTTHLFTSGIEKIKKKTGEEAVELILAGNREELVHESADLIYHLLVLLEASGVEVEELLAELENRFAG